MAISPTVAEQIAKLLNSQNQLTVEYTATRIINNQDRYIVRLSDDGTAVRGVVEVKRVQWYQCEIDHLSVDPGAQRQGIGGWLVQKAEERARQLGARVAQCTIRVGNVASEQLFSKLGYTASVTFVNQETGNQATVYQKSLSVSVKQPI